MKSGNTKTDLRNSFYSGPKIKVFERHLPSLLGSQITVALLENFFKIVSRLDPLYVPSQFHKLWNVLSQSGGNSELKLTAVSEFQHYLRDHRHHFAAGVVEQELGHWGEEEQTLFVAHYTSSAA